MHLFARQGDLVIERLDKQIEGDLIKRSDIVFAGDSSGHRHRLLGTAMVEANSSPQRTRFRIVEPMQLAHEKPDGHKTIDLLPGDYEIRPLRERGDGSDRAVED
jgi:hypothetical protein